MESILEKAIRRPITPEEIETFPKPDYVTSVEMSSEEVTAVCPVTGQPDWYRVAIRYTPNSVCLESKSLKLYLWGFRDKGEFCEALASRIAQELFDVLKPGHIMVELRQRPRGGVGITARAERSAS